MKARVYGKTYFGGIVELKSFNPYISQKYYLNDFSIAADLEIKMKHNIAVYRKNGIEVSNDLVKRIAHEECRTIMKHLINVNIFPRADKLRAMFCREIIADIDDLSGISAKEFAEIVKSETKISYRVLKVAALFIFVYIMKSAAFLYATVAAALLTK